jgi:hypothetical protein
VFAVQAVICTLLYAHTPTFPLQFDGVRYLQNNPLVRDGRTFAYLTEFSDFINRPLKLGLDPDLAANIASRPVSYATFHLNYLFPHLLKWS